MPDFKVKNEKGRWIRSEKLKGKKLILFFYPQDNTPSCTNEACSIRDDYRKLRKAGYHIFGISPDSVKKHQNFIEKFGFKFSLLADIEKQMIEAFGLWGPKMFMGREVIGVHRTTFIVNEQGIIEHIIQNVITKIHARQILELVTSDGNT